MRFVIDSRYVRTRPSGIGHYVEALISRLPGLASDEQFHLWTHPERPRPVSAPNLTHSTVSAPADGMRTLLWPTQLDPLTEEDVVHFPYSLLGRGIPSATVVTIHDIMWLEHPELVDARPLVRRARQGYYQAGMRMAMHAATRIIAVSRATADRIVAFAPDTKARVRVTHNAVPDAFRPAEDREQARERASELIGTSAPYYLVVGKNEPYKAHQLALHAFAAAALPHEQLVMVQRTGRGHRLRRLCAELGVTDRVRWMPGLSQAQIVSLLQGARALLQPSLMEGFGIPVLEAISCGCPVVASDTPALVEVLDGAGLHAPTGSAAGLADALRKLEDPTLWGELSERGLERARDFSWDATAAATLEVYREVAAEGPRR
jgi:glycosyltransferase involved in cell wall biosynthesis